jgi:hypothetical protein
MMKKGNCLCKVDGNRRITLKKNDDVSCKVEFVDMLIEKKIKDKNGNNSLLRVIPFLSAFTIILFAGISCNHKDQAALHYFRNSILLKRTYISAMIFHMTLHSMSIPIGIL